MADADKFDLLGLDVDLGEVIDQARLRCDVRRRHGVAGIPQHILIAMLDEIATEDELNFQVAIGKRIREALVDGCRRLRRAAIEARQRHVRRLRLHRKTGEQAGGGSEFDQYSLHCFFPLNCGSNRRFYPVWRSKALTPGAHTIHAGER